MIPSVLASQLKQGVEDFLRTTFPVSTPFFHGILDRLLAEPESLFQGPFLDLQLPFQMGESDTAPFPNIALPFTPYLHQERAFDRLSGPRPRSTLIATGTGSGKTECFLYPILDHCIHHRGEPGVKAILIYPMNALASDQAARIAKTIHHDPNLKSMVTAGLFVGQSEKNPHYGMTEDAIISHKDTLRHSPPDILLTNYKMLDYLLIRPRDFPLWSQNAPETLRYLVVDELHTFDGAQGTDLACLLRRLKSRLKTPEGHLCCIGTSATLGDKTEHRRLLDYATEIFGEPLAPDAVISEYRVSTDAFLEKSVTFRMDIVHPSKADQLDPERYTGFGDYISSQHALWFNEPIPPGDIPDGPWRAALREKLKGHLFFQSILRVLGGRVRRYADILTDLERVTPEFKSAPETYKTHVLTSLLALVSSAVEVTDGREKPFLHVRHHLWLRELRRMTGKVDPAPELRFADDLTHRQLKHHLPLVHCRECGGMGWLGVKRMSDNAVITDLQTVYGAFFRNDPKTIFIFPEAADPREIQADGWLDQFCGACVHFASSLSVRECPHCGQSRLIRVFVPNPRIQRRDGKPAGSRNCPYCNALNGLTILGSRAASLTSVMIAQMYASTFNDDKKLLTFSDSVQDAAHRAGFFTSRTYRFNLRSAIQQYVQADGDGLTLKEIPAGFIRYWSSRMDDRAFIATFIAPDMMWLADYEALKRTGHLPAGADLSRDVKLRVEWEIHAEYGFRCRIGRTLEKTGSSVAHPDADLLDRMTAEALKRLRNEIGGLRSLDVRTVKTFIMGILVHIKQQGGLHHPALDAYIQEWGNTSSINRIPWMPNFGFNSRAPAFLSTKRVNRFDPLLSAGTRRATWHESWADKCFTPVFPLAGELIAAIYDIVLKTMTGAGALKETAVKGERVWSIDPAALRVRAAVVQFRCRTRGHDISVAESETDAWTNAPCLRFRCEGNYAPLPAAEDYYRKLYSAGDIERIFAEEHTGLLGRDEREALEARFKKKDRDPWDPNLLSCTPTLEMGIDIGDLSSAILCSVPPTRANYLQRIGRAGRRDGNALNLTVANGRPHDLYFFAEPEAMIAGELDPPGVFLNASAVLERQFTAFCLDRWVETGISQGAMPYQLRNVLGNLDPVNPDRFPYTFLRFVETRRTDLFGRFIRIFETSLTADSIDHLRRFVEGDASAQGSLSHRIVTGLHAHYRERESLKKKVIALSGRIRKKKENPARDAHHAEELENLIREKSALQALVTRINDRPTLEFFTDEGLIPNYAFPEAGVLLRSIIYRRKKAPREGESRYDTFTFDYERPARSAISELAPKNPFYAGGRKVRVDQVDLSVSDVETWRFCNNCGCHGQVVRMPAAGACPQCGSPLWSDAGQKRRMIRMRQVFAATSDRDSRISDDSDDREPSFYNKQMLIWYRPTDIADAFRIDGDDPPFGLEFLKQVSLREINFGEKTDIGEHLTIAGVESARKGFVICKHCGKVQNHRKEIQHSLWCRARKKASDENLTECVYLYREFTSEAILMLPPVTNFSGTDRQIHSFLAALHLGLKRFFRGNIDHLQTSVHETPVPNSSYRKKHLVLYDTVPGGTGYLKQLMRSEKPLIQVLEAALDVLKTCPCNLDAGKDGCYKCLFAYRHGYNMAGTSREAAREMLSEILRHKDKMVRTHSLDDVKINPLFDSELEARFIEALRRVRIDDTPAKLTQEVVNGKRGYFYKIGDRAYYIELQAKLGPADGVAVPSKADFLFRPARAQETCKPLAVFTDGFFFHKDQIGHDMAQRRAIVRSGRFYVWSLTWKDLENQYKRRGGYFHDYLAFDNPEKFSTLLKSYRIEKIPRHHVGDSFQWLTWFLADPNEEQWRYHAFVHGLLHLDHQRFSAEAEQAAWREALNEAVPEEIAERVEDVRPPCFYGLYESEGDRGFLKWFAAIEKDALKKGKTDGLRTAWCLMDGPADREKPEFEAAWNGFLRCGNLFQFLPESHFSTADAKAAGISFETGQTEAPSSETETSGEWRDVLELTDARFHGLINRLARGGWAVPEVGFELVNDAGEIIAEAELAWTDLEIAMLEADQSTDKDAFETAGWRVFEIETVVSNLDEFLETTNHANTTRK